MTAPARQPAEIAASVIAQLARGAAGGALALVIGPPMPFLIGPPLLRAALHGAGAVDATTPGWMLNLAQVVIGTGLGATFAGISRAQLVKPFALGALSVALYQAIGIGFAKTLSVLTPIPLPARIISFAPGCVTERSLVALSLNIGPIIVAAHRMPVPRD